MSNKSRLLLKSAISHFFFLKLDTILYFIDMGLFTNLKFLRKRVKQSSDLKKISVIQGTAIFVRTLSTHYVCYDNVDFIPVNNRDVLEASTSTGRWFAVKGKYIYQFQTELNQAIFNANTPITKPPIQLHNRRITSHHTIPDNTTGIAEDGIEIVGNGKITLGPGSKLIIKKA